MTTKYVMINMVEQINEVTIIKYILWYNVRYLPKSDN